jgi:raffinose/stachyose/melibiose transport system permease protein
MTTLINQKFKDRAAGLAFLLPAIALFLGFVVYPIIFNVQTSTLDWNGVTAGKFVGIDNYVDLFNDPVFLITIRNSALWIVFTLVPQAIIGLLLALMLNTRLRGHSIYRAIFFIPAVLSPVVVGLVWQRLYDPFNGVLSLAGKALGTDLLTQGYLSDPNTVIFAVMVVNVWMFTGLSMLFYLAGLQLIDSSVLEAARIDGATLWQMITRIIWPLLKSTHLTLALLGIIGSLKTFELVYVLTLGGPNHASELLPTYAYKQAFTLQHLGYAAAISVVLLVVAVLSSLTMVRRFGTGFISGVEK